MALREIRDTHGLLWLVFAVRPSVRSRATGGTRAELSGGWLCFQRDDERRRLPGVPDAWESMTDEALMALLPTEAVVPPSVRGAIVDNSEAKR
jgi:hypothetical protein